MILSVFVSASTFFTFAQQTVAPAEPSVFYYEIEVVEIGQWSDDGTIKMVQTAFKPVFERILPLRENTNTFYISTDFPVTENAVRRTLVEAGFELQSFEIRTPAKSGVLNHEN